jgi:tRNA pseudouridine55 synthase
LRQLSRAVDGFLNLHKPTGLTSHDCVARGRKLLKQKRIGHGGTLDPAATGVLPIALGRATRLLQYLSHQKAYRATIRLGVTTTTDDLAGDVLTQTSAVHLTLDVIRQQLPQFEGKIEQIPPSYSAIQVGGKRLYELARAGQQVTAPVRTVEVYSIEILSWRAGEFPELELAIACGAGTYIRSIARDLGAGLGTGGTLAGLIRTASSGFQLTDSLSLEQWTEQVEAGCFSPISPQIALRHLPLLTATAAEVKAWQQGQRLLWEHAMPDCAICQLQHPDGQFLGIGQIIAQQSSNLLVPKLVFRAED